MTITPFHYVIAQILMPASLLKIQQEAIRRLAEVTHVSASRVVVRGR